MKKISKYIIPLLGLIAIIAVTLTAYYTVKDTKSYPTKQIEQECNIQTDEYMGRKIFTIKPKEGNTNNQVILYFHGGAYVAEMTTQHWEFIEKLVKDTGSTVILPDYPLVPKYSYHDVFKMAVPLYKEIIERVQTNNLIVMGDSAGGGLALALEEKMSEDKFLLPSKTILISPWLDVSMSNEKIDEVQKNDKDLNKETLALAGIAYAKEENTKEYLVSPLYGNLKGLNNITIYTGTYDILNPDVHTLKEKADEVGTQIEIKEYAEAQHIWIIKHNSDERLVNEAYQDLIRRN